LAGTLLTSLLRRISFFCSTPFFVTFSNRKKGLLPISSSMRCKPQGRLSQVHGRFYETFPLSEVFPIRRSIPASTTNQKSTREEVLVSFPLSLSLSPKCVRDPPPTPVRFFGVACFVYRLGRLRHLSPPKTGLTPPSFSARKIFLPFFPYTVLEKSLRPLLFETPLGAPFALPHGLLPSS